MSSQAPSPSRYRRSPDVVARRIRGEHVLVPIRRSSTALDSIFTLNETAGFIWEQAGDGADLDTLAHALCARYAVAPDAARADVRRVVDDLVAAGALVPAEGAA